MSYGYDDNSNLTLIDYPNMADVSFSHNKLDDVTQVVDGVGTHAFSYDGYGRLNALDGPLVNDAQSYAYDVQQRMTAQSVEHGISGGAQTQSYAYDALERLQTLTSSGTQGAGTFTYNYVGNTSMLSRLDLPNGAKTTQSYDALQRLTQVQNIGAGNANLASYAYGYDTRDVKTGVQSQLGADPLKQIAYVYDAVDQLTGESASGGATGSAYSNAFTYDAMGNRTKLEHVKGANTTVNSSTPNALNQLTALSTSQNGGAAQTSGLSYDTGGNLTQTTASDGSKTLYTYDDADRLTRIENRNAAGASLSKSEFVYDYASRKVVSREFTYTAGAWVQTNEIRRVFDDLDVVQERDDQNAVTAHYVRDGNIGGILLRTSVSGKSYFHYDGGGNVTALSDENGNLVGRYAYDAFGNTLEASGARAAENPYRFSTKEHIAGLVDFGYRFYSPGMGRWLNRDPIRESGGVNLYGMVGNDPVNNVDPYGLWSDPLWQEKQRRREYDRMPWYGKVWENIKPYSADIIIAIGSARAGGGRLGGGRLGGGRPPSLSPPGAGRSGAFSEAKRRNGIPNTQQPSRVLPNVDKRGDPQRGKIYEFETPNGRKTIRDDAGGHDFGRGDPQNRGPHFNDDAGNHYDYCP